jgi:ubiquitin carboxyl-terminal hydrolase 47
VYELYGVMLHSGGAYGGHYSAYIKDFENADSNSIESEDCWYHFNDSFVKKISITEILKAFG